MSGMPSGLAGTGPVRCFLRVMLPAVLLAASAPVFAAGPQVKAELFWESMDGQAWHGYFLLDAARRRMGENLDIRVTCLVKKGADGSWQSPRGKEEVGESMRMAVLQQFHPKQFWNYLAGRSLNSWEGGWKDAARFAGISPEKLEKEVKERGDSMLESHLRRAREFNAERPVIFVAGKPYSGEWKLMPLIEALNAGLPPDRRLSVPALPAAEAVKPPKFWVLVSSSNPFAREDQNLTAAISRTFEGVKPAVLDYDSGLPQALAGLDVKFLPAYVLEDTPSVRSVFRQAIEKGMLYPKNGYFVVSEKSREGVFLGRPHKPGLLELFVMSQCPYGVQAENSVIEASKKKLLPEGTRVRVRYIADISAGPGTEKKFQSLHGTAEWEEDVRQLVIQERYPEKFFDYLSGRNADPNSSMWESAAGKAGVDPASVLKEFEKGKELLALDAKAGAELGINSSPTFLWEGRVLASGMAGLKKISGFENIPLQNPGSGQQGCGKN